MFSRLLALFVVIPALELYLLIRIGSLIGALETFGIILLTGLIGSYMAKSQGLAVWRRLQAKLATGGLPGDELIDAVIILVSGALLVTPGVLTDIAGLLGLFPATRAAFRKLLRKRFSERIKTGHVRFGAFGPIVTNNGFTGRASRSEQAATAPPDSESESAIEIGGSARRRPGSN